MTRAADRLIVGGCMPGNMNTVRKFSWYDLIVKGLGNSGLQLQEIRNTGRHGEALFAAGGRRCCRRARLPLPAAIAPAALPAWLRMPAPAELPADRSAASVGCGRRRSRRVRTGESLRPAPAPCSAARWCTGCCNPCPTSRSDRRRDAAPTLSRPQCRRLDRGRTRGAGGKSTGPDRGPALRGGIRRRQPRRGLDRRAAGSAGTVAGAGFRADRPAGGDAKRGADRRLQDQPCPARQAAEAPGAYVRQLALYRAILEKIYPQLPVRAALLWTETPELMEISAPALDAQLASIIYGDERA